MGLVLITLQDEPDGTVSLGFSTDPQIQSENQELSDAQILGMMAVHQIMLAISGDQEEETSSIER